VVVSQLSAAAAALVWTTLDAHENKPTSLGMITGAIAGLAAITPAAGVVGPMGGVAIGVLSALICRFFSTAVKARFSYDDSLDVFGVHGMGGLVGTLALAAFGHVSLGGSSSVAMGSQLAIQVLAAVFTALYTLVVSFALLKLTAALTGGLRVSDAAEQLGLDAAELGEEAYMTTSAW
jgi:ammonia channel protein AmtB